LIAEVWVKAATSRGPVERFDYHLEAQVPNPTTAPIAKISAPGHDRHSWPARRPAGHHRNEGPAAFHGVWIDGDGTGNEFLMRFTDTTGQTFQTNPQHLDWTGWRAVEFSLDDPSVWHYRGAKDDVIHCPIQLNALFLIESPQREATSGRIFLADPTIVWDSQDRQNKLN
jgi:hypothetical protein